MNRPGTRVGAPSPPVAPLALLALLACLASNAPSIAADGSVAAPADPVAAEVSAQAQAVFDRARDKLLQVRMIDRGTQAQTSIGSGWIASPDGVAITNYHVVSQFVLDPDRYTVEFVRSDGARGPLAVLAVDVVHDLALVRMAGDNLPALRLAEAPLRKGDRGFSMGNPHDLGLTIVEGTFNGMTEFTLTEQFNFTGAINAGMSGGPAVTPEGLVFGVNVANLRDGQLLSFLVPVKFVRDLLARAPRTAPEPKTLRATVERQLLDRQNVLFERIARQPMPVAPFGRYSVPDSLGPFMRCWGESAPDRTRPYEQAFKTCDAQGSIYIDGSFDTGGVRFRHELLKSKTLGWLRFSSLYERSFGRDAPEGDTTREDVTPFRCHERFVTHESGTMRVVFCARAYKRLKGLYDVRLKLATLDGTHEGLLSWLALDGVSLERGLAFAKRYLEAVRWTK